MSRFEDPCRDLCGHSPEPEEEVQVRRRLLDVVSAPEMKLQGAEPPAQVQQLLVCKEELLTEQLEWSCGLDQEDSEPPYIKEEQEELWSSRDEEQLQGQEGTDTTMLPFNIITVKSEDDEEESQQMETGADDEEARRNSDPEGHLQTETEIEVKIEESSEAETDDSYDWMETKRQRSLKSEKSERLKSRTETHSCSECGKTFKQKWSLTVHIRLHTGEKPFSCSECGKTFRKKMDLTVHMRVHTGEKPFSCSECGTTFTTRQSLKLHMRMHTGEKPFSCSVCCKNFARKSSVKTHMKIHWEDKPFSCPECDRRYYQQSSLKYHMATHRAEKLFGCSDCGKRFNRRSYLKLHMTQHRGEKPYSCCTCDKKFSFPRQLKKHKCVGDQASDLQNQTVERRKIVAGDDGEDCGGTEPTRNPDPGGFLEPETEVKTEDSCKPESDDDWMTREQHFSWKFKKNVTEEEPKTDEKSHICYECGKIFTTKRRLSRHMRIHTGEKPFSCSVCSKSFNQKQNLTRHMLVHTREKSFICSGCGKRFDPKFCSEGHKCAGGQALEPHQDQIEEIKEAGIGADGKNCGGAATTRNSDPGRPFQLHTVCKTESCPDLETKNKDDGDSLKESREHKAHLSSKKKGQRDRKLEAKKKSYICSKCGKTLKFLTGLTRHMKICNGERPFVCCVCCRRFKRKTQLARHMLVHTQEKPFCCSECGKRFCEKSSLNCHMTRHRGEKPFSCSECGQKFNDQSSMRRHEKRHRGEKLYSCSVCHKQFFWRSQIKRHKCIIPGTLIRNFVKEPTHED